MDFSTRWYDLPALRMHAATAGPLDGVPVILLHGFPQFWYSWRHQMKFLADAGFRVIVPDQRGYNLTDKTPPYDVGTLAQDIVHLIDICGYQDVYLAGHDWGAAVSWALAGLYPERVRRLAILNVPHPAPMANALRGRYLPQLLKSWYMLFFQIQRIPEWLMSRNDYAVMRRLLRSSSLLQTFSDEDVERYRDAWAQPGALSASIGWYRALLGKSGPKSLQGTSRRIRPATLILWGEQDVALDVRLAEQSLAWLEDGDIQRFPEATHWLHEDLPVEINRHLLEHFAKTQ